MTNMDVIDLKQKLGSDLSGQDPEALTATVMYFAYKTISSNKRLTVKKLKALLCVEYLINEGVLDGAIAQLVARGTGFSCVKRWRDPERPISDMAISVIDPPPTEFLNWLSRTEERYPELAVFIPPLYHHKD